MKKTNHNILHKTIIFATSILSTVSAHADWILVTDQDEKMAVSEVEYLVSSDISDYFTIIGTDRTIDEVKSISFANDRVSNIDNLDAESADNVLFANERLNILGLKSSVNVVIMSTEGKQLASQHVGPGDVELELNYLLPGVYILYVNNEGHSKSVKFVKK